jgi:nucleoside-diphosphate-sugar epimerase
MRRTADGSAAGVKIVAIIGADSMLGSELARQLADKDILVIRVGRGSHSDIVFDLSGSFDPDSCKDLQADALIHCASSFEGDDLVGAKVNFSTNTVGCLNVLLLMETLSCKKCCYAGTVSSYENFESGVMNSYGLSKAQGESILDWGMRRIGGQFFSLRLTGLYDTDGKSSKHQPWFGRIVTYASRGMDLRMPDSSGDRNYLHVADAAYVMINALESELSGCWPVCSSEQMNHAEIARLAYDIFGCGGKVLIDSEKLPFRMVNYPSSAELFKRLGVKPAINMTQGLEMIRQAGTAPNFGFINVND